MSRTLSLPPDRRRSRPAVRGADRLPRRRRRRRGRPPDHRTAAAAHRRRPGARHHVLRQLPRRIGHRGDGGLRHHAARQPGRRDLGGRARGVHGAVPALAGAPGKRYALPHARILMHQPSARLGGTASDISIRAGVFGEMKREIAELTARHTGQTVETVTADADRDRWFTAEEAREYGLVDHVAGTKRTYGIEPAYRFPRRGPGEFGRVTSQRALFSCRSEARRDGPVR